MKKKTVKKTISLLLKIFVICLWGVFFYNLISFILGQAYDIEAYEGHSSAGVGVVHCDQLDNYMEAMANLIMEDSGDSVSVTEYATYYTEEDVAMLAKLLYGECRGVDSETEQACVAWVVLNRVDDDEKPINDIITSPYQFAYNSSAPILEDLYILSEDVLMRWSMEKQGVADVGRVLPADYTYFAGDGEHNYFRNAYIGGTKWDYSMESPYES
jgi:hypothetical protein